MDLDLLDSKSVSKLDSRDETVKVKEDTRHSRTRGVWRLEPTLS